MSLYRTGNPAFDAAAIAAETARQIAMASVTDQATADAISRNYFATVINAGAANAVATINEQTALQVLTSP